MKLKVWLLACFLSGCFTITGCSAFLTREANHELEDGYCQDAVAKYERLFKEKPKLKEDKKILANYRKARRCAGDQLVQEAQTTLTQGHPTQAFFLVEEAKEYDPEPQELARVETAVRKEREKVAALLATAQEQAAGSQFDAAGQSVKQAFALDPELLEDGPNGARQMIVLADEYVVGARRALAAKQFAEAEKILLAAQSFLPDHPPVDQALTDTLITWIEYSLETGTGGRALLLAIHAGKSTDDPRRSDLESKALATLRNTMRQRLTVQADDSRHAGMINALRQTLTAGERSLFSSAPPKNRKDLWMLTVADIRQDADYEETEEDCSQTYQSGWQSVPNPEYQSAQQRVEDAQRDVLNRQDQLLNLSDRQAREMENAMRDRERVLENMPTDPNQQSSWRSEMERAEHRVNDLTRDQNNERQRLEQDLQNARQRVFDRQRDLNATPLTKREPAYSEWPYQKLHKTKSALTSLTLKLAASQAIGMAGQTDVAGRAVVADYSIRNPNRQAGVSSRQATLPPDDAVMKESEQDAIARAAIWVEAQATATLADHFFQVYQTEAGEERIEAYVRYALLTPPDKRQPTELPYGVEIAELPYLGAEVAAKKE